MTQATGANGFPGNPASRTIVSLSEARPEHFQRVQGNLWEFLPSGVKIDGMSGLVRGTFGGSYDGILEAHLIEVIEVKRVFDETGVWPEGYNPEVSANAPRLTNGLLPFGSMNNAPEAVGTVGVLVAPPAPPASLALPAPAPVGPRVDPAFDPASMETIFEQFAQGTPENKAVRAIEAAKNLPAKPTWREWLNHPRKSWAKSKEIKRVVAEKNDAENFLAWQANNPEVRPPSMQPIIEPAQAPSSEPHFELTDVDAGIVDPPANSALLEETEEAFLLTQVAHQEADSVIGDVPPKPVQAFDINNDDDFWKVFARAMLDPKTPEGEVVIVSDFTANVPTALTSRGVDIDPIQTWDVSKFGPAPRPGMRINIPDGTITTVPLAESELARSGWGH